MEAIATGSRLKAIAIFHRDPLCVPLCAPSSLLDLNIIHSWGFQNV